MMQALTLTAEWQPRPQYQPSDYEIETRKAQAGSMVWRYPAVSVGELPDPTPAADEVIVAVAAVGICGSDMHMVEADEAGYMFYPGLTRFPNTLGHEFSGHVVAVGSRVTELQPGDIVTAEEIQWCGYCISCRRGYVNHCDNMEELGFTTPGAMAQYVAVRARYCWKLDEVANRLGDERQALLLGAMVEPAGVSYHAMFNRLDTWQPGVYAAVFGAGPIGLTAIALARAAGAAQIIAFDISEQRLEMARRLGATAVYNPAGLALDELLLDLTGGRGVDFVVEAAGAPEHTLTPLRRALAVNASIAYIGRSERPTSLSLEHYQVRGVQLAGSLGHAGHGTFQNVIRLLAAGALDLRPMISAEMPLADAPAAFKRLESRQDCKIMLIPRGNE